MQSLPPRTSFNLGILPGSRNGEVQKNWPVQLEIMRRLYEKFPDIKFVVANYKSKHMEYCQKISAEKQLEHLPLTFSFGKASEVIEHADALCMVSGSISLELLARKKPAVVLYNLHWISELVGKWLITCKFMSLPNLMADRELYPEFLFSSNDEKSIRQMTEILSEWISNPKALGDKIEEISELAEDVVIAGATENAGCKILNYINQNVEPKSDEKTPLAA